MKTPMAEDGCTAPAGPRWPDAHDYKTALQTPAVCFRGTEFQHGLVTCDQHGIPLLLQGSFAFVSEIQSSGRRWAVRLFRREQSDRHERYRAIGRFLSNIDEPFLVCFHYCEAGFQTGSHKYPLLQMDWVAGDQLNVWIEERIANDDLERIRRLADSWAGVAEQMAQRGLAHGDLQHGNILIEGPADQIRLVDYDGMYVPGLQGRPMLEYGYPGFQHPGRQEAPFNADMDRFSVLLIYVALRSLATSPELWGRYFDDNLLFRDRDLQDPTQSRLFTDLAGSPDPEVRRLAGELARACTAPIGSCPQLGRLLLSHPVTPVPPAPPPPPVTPAPVRLLDAWYGVGVVGADGRPGQTVWLLAPGQRLPVHTADLPETSSKGQFSAVGSEPIRIACYRGSDSGGQVGCTTSVGELIVHPARQGQVLRVDFHLMRAQEIEVAVVDVRTKHRLATGLFRA